MCICVCFFSVCMCTSVYVCVFINVCGQALFMRPEENIGSYGSGVPGNCELSEVGGGNSSAALCKSSMCS